MAAGYESLVPQNPLEAIMPLAEELVQKDFMVRGRFDEFRYRFEEALTVEDMNRILNDFNMTPCYYNVKAGLGILIPEDAHPDEDGQVEVDGFELGTIFIGQLSGVMPIRSEIIITAQTIGSICLDFQNPILKYRTIEEDGRTIITSVDNGASPEGRLCSPILTVEEMHRAN